MPTPDLSIGSWRNTSAAALVASPMLLLLFGRSVDGTVLLMALFGLRALDENPQMGIKKPSVLSQHRDIRYRLCGSWPGFTVRYAQANPDSLTNLTTRDALSHY